MAPLTPPANDDAAGYPPDQDDRTVRAAPLPARPAEASAVIWFELAAVCGVILLPGYVSHLWNLFQYHWRPWNRSSSLTSSIHTLTYNLTLIILLRWVISKTGEPPSAFGWVRIRPLRDVLHGVAILVALILLTAILGLAMPDVPGPSASTFDRFVRGAQTQDPADTGRIIEWIIYVLATLSIGFVEEFAMRGYLMMRLRKLLKSGATAAIVSSALWAGWHLYQGLLPVGIHFVQGLFLAWMFLKLQRLWPLVLAHTGMNLMLPWVPYWQRLLE
jgi:membrane protease YdiL (CAAX protease family)